MLNVTIRPECFLPATQGWQQPSGVEIRMLVKLTGMNVSMAARLINVGHRQFRRWISEETPIPYSAWVVVAALAGHVNFHITEEVYLARSLEMVNELEEVI